MTDPLHGMELFDESGEVTRAHADHPKDIEALVPDDVPAATVRITRRRPGDKKPTSVELRIERERIRVPDSTPPKRDCGCHDKNGHHD
jgi:hypothetical protein